MTLTNPLVAIVDDDASVCRALKRLVRSLEFEAETFPSCEAYLQALGEFQFHADCLVLDLQMPGMSGLELQSRLTNDSTPIIIITAHDDGRVREQALAGGAFAFLNKPFRDEIFIDTLESVLRDAERTKPDE